MAQAYDSYDHRTEAVARCEADPATEQLRPTPALCTGSSTDDGR